MPEAKIELLIRKSEPGGEGFSIRNVPSGLVYAGYRPRRIDPSGYTAAEETSPLDGRKHCVLNASGSDKYLSLSEREQFLWGLMDGSRSIREIAAEYFSSYGSLDFEAIRKLLGRLREAGLIEFIPSSGLRVALDRSGRPWARWISAAISKVDFRLDDADGWVEKRYNGGGYLLVSRTAMALYTLMSVAGIAAFFSMEGEGLSPHDFIFRHPVAAAAIVLLALYPVTAVHEMFHALACKRFGRKVYAFGFTLWDGFYPSFYTDVSDIHLSPRSERIYVTLAGPISTTAISAVFLLPVAFSPGSPWAETLYQIGRFNLLIAFVTLYPFQFLKMDGYYLLVDMLGLPGLRERTFSMLAGLPAQVRAGKPFTKSDIIMAAYFLLSAASIIAFSAYFFGQV